MTDTPDPKDEASVTPITLTVGNVVVPAALNGTVTAQRVVERLPASFALDRFEHDYCGSAQDLPTDPAEQQSGWLDGDIGYGGGWFSLLFSGQEQSHSYSNMMIIGHVDREHLEKVRALGRSVQVTVSAR